MGITKHRWKHFKHILGQQELLTKHFLVRPMIFSLVHSLLFHTPIHFTVTGADPGFQVRGGALKKIAPSGGKRENFGGISCEKSRLYTNKSYLFQF